MIDLKASSFPGITKSMGSGLALLSAIPTIGIPSFLASKTANLSLTISKITIKSGLPSKLRIPPMFETSFSFSLDKSNNSFLDKF